MKDIIDALNWRYATKKFDPNKKLDAESEGLLLESLRLAPSSFGIQPRKFIVIKDQRIKEKLVECSGGQTQVQDCSHMIVLCKNKKIDREYIQKLTTETEKIRNKTPGEVFQNREEIGKVGRILKYYDQENSAAKEVFIALGFLLETCALLGIDSCPMGGIDKAGYDKALELEKTDYETVVTCAIGYRGADDKYSQFPKVRNSLESIIQII